MKTFLILIVIIITAVSSACAEDAKVYDENWNLEYRVQEDGRIYDQNWNLQGTVKNDKIYDRNSNLEYRVKDNKTNQAAFVATHYSGRGVRESDERYSGERYDFRQTSSAACSPSSARQLRRGGQRSAPST